MRLLPSIKRIGAEIVAITGNPQSTLAKGADYHLSAAISKEACPLGLAPTASTTATLALGDALAMALLHAKRDSRKRTSHSSIPAENSASDSCASAI